MPKLTLSVDRDVVKKAKQHAAKNKTSVSAMFERFIRLISGRQGASNLGPITRELSGIAQLPRGKTDRQLLEDALNDKYAK